MWSGGVLAHVVALPVVPDFALGYVHVVLLSAFLGRHVFSKMGLRDRLCLTVV